MCLYTCISSTAYPLLIDDLLCLPDVAPDAKTIKEYDVVLLIGSKEKNIPDKLYQGRKTLEKLKAEGQTTVQTQVAFFRNRPAWDLLAPFCRAFRNRFHSFGTNVYHIDPKKIREMGLERGKRTKENAYRYAKWPLSEEQRQKQYNDLKNSLETNGYDDKFPIELMLCRSFGVKDTIYQGHHRIMFCIDMNIPLIAIRFMYVTHAPRFLQKPMLLLSKWFKK